VLEAEHNDKTSFLEHDLLVLSGKKADLSSVIDSMENEHIKKVKAFQTEEHCWNDKIEISAYTHDQKLKEYTGKRCGSET
jgi:hypothetical protein